MIAVIDSSTMKVRFDGQMHQIDVNTLLVSLLHLSDMTRDIVEDLSPGATVKMLVSAPERGSFVIDLEIIQKVEETLAAYAPFIPQVVSTVLGLLEIKRLLKGKKPDRVETTNEGTTIIVEGNAQIAVNSNVFETYSSNERVNVAMSKMFTGIAENPEIHELEIKAPDIGEFRAEHADFAGMGRPNELLAEEKKVSVERVHLVILKIVFEKARVWEFIYHGNKISAPVNDDAFWAEVDSQNVRFGKGDQLFVELEITQVYNADACCFVNKSYLVKKVLDKLPRPDQLRFDEQ